MEPAVDALITHVETHVDDFEEPTADILAPVELEDLEHAEVDAGHSEEGGE